MNKKKPIAPRTSKNSATGEKANTRATMLEALYIARTALRSTGNYDATAFKVIDTAITKAEKDIVEPITQKTKQLLLTEVIERYPRMLAVLRELVTDCEAVGIDDMACDWPDLLVTYNKAKALVESAK